MPTIAMPTIATPTTMPPAPIAEAQACRAIAFQIAGHWLALPSTAVLRVVHRAALTTHAGSDQAGLQPLIYVGNQPLPIADLHPILAAAQGNQPPADTGQFLLIVAAGTLVAIPSDQPPTLIEVLLTATHPVPAPYYKAIRGIASHMAMVPPLGTVLLLNLCRLEG